MASTASSGLVARSRLLAGRVLNLAPGRYLLVSFAALCADVSVFFVAMALDWGAVIASVAGYCAGIQLHWLLSSRWVFAGRMRASGAPRLGQQGLFIASALLGLALTTAVVAASQAAGMHPTAGKGMAIVGSFCLTYLLRSAIVFRPAEDIGGEAAR